MRRSQASQCGGLSTPRWLWEKDEGGARLLKGAPAKGTHSTGPQTCLYSCRPSPWISARPTECTQPSRDKKVSAQKEGGDCKL